MVMNNPSKLNCDQRRKRNNILWRFTWIAEEDCSTSASKRSAPSEMTFSWLLWVTAVAATYIVNNMSDISQKSLEELLVLIVYKFFITWFVHFDLLHLQASAQWRFNSLHGHNPLPPFSLRIFLNMNRLSLYFLRFLVPEMDRIHINRS